jgi:hypothetical protein
MGTIKHAAVLKKMNTGERFALTFVTLDKKRKKGGDLVELTDARKHQAGDYRKEEVKEQNAAAVMLSGVEAPATTAPHHDKHGTINIKCADGNIRKVHTRLIVKFNGEEVTL